LKATGNLAKGVESTTALAEYATRPLAWRPGRKRRGSKPTAPAGAPEAEANQPEEEEPMPDDTSGATAKPKPDQVRNASSLLKRAAFNPKSAKHVTNTAKAAAAGPPGAVVAQAAIAEARKKQAKVPGPTAAMPFMPRPVRATAFTSWARGAA